MPGLDLKGAAHDLDLRAARWSRLLAQHPELMIIYRLCTRHPWVARDAAKAIMRLVNQRPELAQSPEEPLFQKAS